MKTMHPKDLLVYRDILKLVWKYGNRSMLSSIGFEKHLEKDDTSDAQDNENHTAEDFASDLEKLGPTYVKIGQILATQLPILPAQYKQAMERLQDDVEAIPFNEVAPIIESELGSPILSLFEKIDTLPIGAGSLAQVHTATLKNETQVAIKVQRPGALKNVNENFRALEHVASTIDTMTNERYGLVEILEHTRKTLLDELDFRHEASNLSTIGRHLKKEPMILVPRPVVSLCSQRVLTMSYHPGEKVTELSPRRIDELDGDKLAGKLFRSYMHQILVQGTFHADPHPGNVLLDQQGRIILLDLGMVGHISPNMREMLTQLVLAIADGRGDQVADITIRIGEPDRTYDHMHFTQQVNNLVMQCNQNPVEGIQLGKVLLDIANICAEDRVRLPPIMTTIGKTLLNLDELARTIAPTFNPSDTVRRYSSKILTKHFRRSFSRMRLYDAAIEISRLVEEAPRRMNKLLDTIVRQDLGLKIDAIDEEKLISGFEKIANRITFGLIVAALYLSGAMTLNVEHAGPRFGDVPLLSILLFMGAFLGTGMILMTMYFKRSNKK
tara:strand:+ start:1447 stop:3108 length:1662 start_codon:yes stop_codon:yes gene_type:complete